MLTRRRSLRHVKLPIVTTLFVGFHKAMTPRCDIMILHVHLHTHTNVYEVASVEIFLNL